MKTQPGANGGTLRVGNPGNAGGTGRPPKKFSTFMRELRESSDVQAAIEAAAKNPASRGFPPTLRAMTDYDDERPAEKQQIIGPIEIRVKFVREGRKATK